MRKFLLCIVAFSFVLTLIPLQTHAQGFIVCGGNGYETKADGSYITQPLVSPLPPGWAKLNDTTMVQLQHACGLCDITSLVTAITTFFLWPDAAINKGLPVVPILAIIFIIIGGIYMMLGGGNPRMMEQGKRILLSVAIGLAIIYGSVLVLNALFQLIGLQQWTGLGTWWTPTCK